MIRLYHRPQTRSVRIHWLLEEMGLDYELETLSDAAWQSSDYRKINPFGKVPTLVDGDVTIWESTAITDYLLATYDDGQFAPPPGTPDAAEHMSWRHFAEATLISTVADYAINTFWRHDEERLADVAQYAKEAVQPILDVLNAHLDNREFMLGSAFSATDVMVGHAAISCQMLDLIGPDRAHLERYATSMRARPAFLKISADW
ncbi:MAG: glutathione S-transferase family protein [Pseudomonadota bacterium]